MYFFFISFQLILSYATFNFSFFPLGGNVVDHFVKMLMAWQKDLDLPPIDAVNLHSKIKYLCNQEFTVGATGVKIIATLNGERHDVNKTAQVLNIKPENCSLASIVQNLHLGIIANLFEMMPVKLLKSLGIRRIACTGSFFSNNEFIKDALEAMSTLPCVIKTDADASFGASLSC